MNEEKTIRVNNIIYEKPIRYIKTSCESSQITFGDEEGTREVWLYPEIKKGDVFMDIGAAYGSYTIPVIVLGAKTVIAFSPQYQYETLVDNIKLNYDKTWQKYYAYKLGLYSETGYLRTSSQMFFKTYNEAEFDFHPSTEDDTVIKVVPLDSLSLRVDKIDIIKIDTEGAELNVLKGARNTLKKYKPRYIIVENHNFKFRTIEQETIDFMDSLNLGYTHETVGFDPNDTTKTRFKLI